METQQPVSTASNKGTNTIWFILGGVVLACCCGAVVIAGVAGLFVLSSSSTTTSNPDPISPTTNITPQVQWLVTADELNSFSADIGVIEWEFDDEAAGQYRACRSFSGVSWSVTPNEARNCIAQSASNSLDDVITSMIQSGDLYADEVPVEVSLDFNAEYALYAGTAPSAHSLYDLFLLQDGLLYWATVTVGTPAGVGPVELYQSQSQVIQSFLENIIRINLQRSQ